MKIEIVPAQLNHIIDLCEHMRDREREAFKKLGDNPERLLTQEVAKSFLAFAGLADGQTVNIWGAQCVGILSDEAYIWMICTDRVNNYPMTFLRHSRRAIKSLRPHFKHLHGLVVDEFVCSVKWLEWLGFEVDEPKNGVRAFRS